MSRRTGPFENEAAWPRTLRAAAIDVTEQPRLHGYDLEHDLARHYSMGEIMLLGLTGEAPTRVVGRAFDVALVFACVCPINEAPTHAAVLARAVGAPVASALASGFVVATEAARTLAGEHCELLRWLDAGGEGPLPACAQQTMERDASAVDTLRELLLEVGASALAPPTAMSRAAAILTVMWHCGLRTDEQLIVPLAWAKTLSIATEACSVTNGTLIGYPARLPNFSYEAPPR